MQTPTLPPLLNLELRGDAAGGIGAPIPPPSTENETLPRPDWDTASDEAFLKAAQVVFAENAELLRRLA